jgi:hypothetical protein
LTDFKRMSDSHRGRLLAPAAPAFFSMCCGKKREAHLSTAHTTESERRRR